MDKKENNQTVSSVYADYTNTNFNLHNFTLYFGGIEEGQKHIFGKIKMSPESIKELFSLLKSNIKLYEEIYGKINEYTPEVAKREREFIDNKNKKDGKKIEKK